jgi:hypothetical protein
MIAEETSVGKCKEHSHHSHHQHHNSGDGPPDSASIIHDQSSLLSFVFRLRKRRTITIWTIITTMLLLFHQITITDASLSSPSSLPTIERESSKGDMMSSIGSSIVRWLGFGVGSGDWFNGQLQVVDVGLPLSYYNATLAAFGDVNGYPPYLPLQRRDHDHIIQLNASHVAFVD